jgi:hypothetical protein
VVIGLKGWLEGCDILAILRFIIFYIVHYLHPI